ncbi:hypothetical protein [Paraburkholderia piptadeniae]|uniref:hypothetical protein n=1 Tax=Paraburkholderia piptadeniae TaxID=1701573 RepID=UPI0011806D72|nr:hypothetical protein [Paraburkholderia piptadeniae]
MTPPDANHTVGAIAPGASLAGIVTSPSRPTSVFLLLTARSGDSSTHRQNIEQLPHVHRIDIVFLQTQKKTLSYKAS